MPTIYSKKKYVVRDNEHQGFVKSKTNTGGNTENESMPERKANIENPPKNSKRKSGPI